MNLTKRSRPIVNTGAAFLVISSLSIIRAEATAFGQTPARCMPGFLGAGATELNVGELPLHWSQTSGVA